MTKVVFFVGIPYFVTRQKRLPHDHPVPEGAKYCPECGESLFSDYREEYPLAARKHLPLFSTGYERFFGLEVKHAYVGVNDSYEIPMELIEETRKELQQQLKEVGIEESVKVYIEWSMEYSDYD